MHQVKSMINRESVERTNTQLDTPHLEMPMYELMYEKDNIKCVITKGGW